MVAVLCCLDVAAISELQSSSLCGICGTCGIFTNPEPEPLADVGVTGREPEADGAPDESALPLSRGLSKSRVDGRGGDGADSTEYTDAGDTLREFLAEGDEESRGERVEARDFASDSMAG